VCDTSISAFQSANASFRLSLAPSVSKLESGRGRLREGCREEEEGEREERGRGKV
jgi:hypothetical protein